MSEEKKIMDNKLPFELDDIEDVRMIIVAKGKYWAMLGVKGEEENAQMERVTLTCVLLGGGRHFIVEPDLAEIKKLKS